MELFFHFFEPAVQADFEAAIANPSVLFNIAAFALCAHIRDGSLNTAAAMGLRQVLPVQTKQISPGVMPSALLPSGFVITCVILPSASADTSAARRPR